MSGGQTPKQVQLILDFKPDIIMVTPSYMLNIADEFEAIVENYVAKRYGTSETSDAVVSKD